MRRESSLRREGALNTSSAAVHKSRLAPLHAVPARAREEWLCLVVLGWYAAVLLLLGPRLITNDSWLTLVAGRTVADDGIPHTDTLTVLARGREWIDQQWLAQLVWYRMAQAGLELAFFAHVGLLVAAAAVVVVAARRRGASVRSVALVTALLLLAAPWSWYLRSQALAYVFFALVLLILDSAGRTARPRALLVLPLLVLWANVHGSVLIGAAVVTAYGVLALVRWRGLAPLQRLVAGALAASAAAVLVTPYGFAIERYYELLLLHPPFRALVTEWERTPLAPQTAIFWLTALAAVVLLLRRPRTLGLLEAFVLALTLASAVLAIRGVVWFALAAAVYLPAALDERLPGLARRRPGRLDGAFAVAAVAGVVGLAVWTASSFDSRYAAHWPDATAVRVQAELRRDPAALVLTDEWLADWLLWRVPELEGRLAFDARIELVERSEAVAIVRFLSGAGDWPPPGAGYSIVALRPKEGAAIRRLVARRGYRIARCDALACVLLRDA